jgi:hypothetical protein
VILGAGGALAGANGAHKKSAKEFSTMRSGWK